MKGAQPGFQPSSGVLAALHDFSKSMPTVDPQIFQLQEVLGTRMMAALQPISLSTFHQIQAAMAPLTQSINLQLQAAIGVLDVQRQVAAAIAPALASLGQVRLPNLRPIADAVAAMDLAASMPNLSILGHLGEMVANGELAPDFVQTARDAVDEVPGYSHEIRDFSARKTIASVFDAQTITDGTYIFVFIVWLIGSMWVSGMSVEAKALSDAVGLTNVVGAHVVASYAKGKTKKVVIKKGDTRRR